MKKPRIYVDTSVFGGVFDEEFKRASLEFFGQVRKGFFQIVISELVEQEIATAPRPVRDFYKMIFPLVENVVITKETYELSQSYISAKIVTDKSMGDAMHVALATIAKCELIVSWNFKHIVHFDKIVLYNAINTAQGYGHIAIHSPLEVI